MKTQGVDIDELRTLVAVLDLAERHSRYAFGLKTANGGYATIRLAGIDSGQIHLTCEAGRMDASDTELSCHDKSYNCHMPLGPLLDASTPLEQRAESIGGWSLVETREFEEYTSHDGEGRTVVRSKETIWMTPNSGDVENVSPRTVQTPSTN
jgi:hypothetical protein